MDGRGADQEPLKTSWRKASWSPGLTAESEFLRRHEPPRRQGTLQFSIAGTQAWEKNGVGTRGGGLDCQVRSVDLVPGGGGPGGLFRKHHCSGPERGREPRSQWLWWARERGLGPLGWEGPPGSLRWCDSQNRLGSW